MKKTSTLQSSAAVESANPGFTSVSGPYNINQINLVKAKDEQNALDRALVDQQKLCPHAKRVDHGRMVWIVRKKVMIVDASTKNKNFTGGNLGIKAGKGGAQG